MEYALALGNDESIKGQIKVKLSKFDSLQLADQAEIGRALTVRDHTSTLVMGLMRDELRNDQLKIMAYEQKLQRALTPQDLKEFVSGNGVSALSDEVDRKIVANLKLRLAEATQVLRK
jgi:hypothetical protein